MKEKIELVQRLPFIKEFCAGKKVLHLGCSDYPYTETAIREGSLMHAAIQEAAAEVYGFDLDEPSLEILRKHGIPNLYQADLEHLEYLDLDEKFDVIIAGEMIEHLNNPGLFLSGIRKFCRPDTDIVITTVNAYCAMRVFRYAFTQRYGRNEPVHPDHVAYYSFHTLTGLIERHQMEVTDFLFYDLGVEHRRGTPFIFKAVNDIAVGISRQLADGIIAVCRIKDETSA